MKRVVAFVMILVLFTLFGCVPISVKHGDEVVNSSIDATTYTYSDKAMVEIWQCYDMLNINIAKESEHGDWFELITGYIKRFAYVDGTLIIEFYDKWYTFDVENYDVENIDYDLKEYESEEELKEIFVNWDNIEWRNGSKKYTDKYIKEHQLSGEFRISQVHEEHLFETENY